MKRSFTQESFRWLVVILSIHIFSVLAGLLHGLNGKNESLWLAFVFAASYAMASGFTVYLANQKWLIFSYAIMDAIGVYCYYFQGTPSWVIAIYFAVYTFGIVASTVYLHDTPHEEEPPKTMKGMAKKLGLSMYELKKKIAKK